MTRQINCLLIEDDIRDKNVFERFVSINDLDYNVFYAKNVREAFDIVYKELIDVIVSDISFADGDIYKVLDQVKNTPVIVVTSEGEEEIAARVLQMGAADYFIKDMKRNYLAVLPPAINKAIQNQKNEILSYAFVDVLQQLDSAICVFNALGEILFATIQFREMFGLKDGAFLLNIRKLLKSVLLKDHPYDMDEIHFETLIGKEIDFQLKLRGEVQKINVKLIPVRDKQGEILGYVWVEKKDFK